MVKAKEGEVVKPKQEKNTTIIIVIVVLVILGLCGLCSVCAYLGSVISSEMVNL